MSINPRFYMSDYSRNTHTALYSSEMFWQDKWYGMPTWDFFSVASKYLSAFRFLRKCTAFPNVFHAYTSGTP